MLKADMSGEPLSVSQNTGSKATFFWYRSEANKGNSSTLERLALEHAAAHAAHAAHTTAHAAAAARRSLLLGRLDDGDLGGAQ